MRKTEEWGDEQVEIDASEAIEEAHGNEEKALWYFIKRSGKRVAVAIGGFGTVIIGLILVPLPGPGWLIVFGGLALLATEFVWAERLLTFAKERVGAATSAVFKGSDAPVPAGKPASSVPKPLVTWASSVSISRVRRGPYPSDSRRRNRE